MTKNSTQHKRACMLNKITQQLLKRTSCALEFRTDTTVLNMSKIRLKFVTENELFNYK